MCMLWVLPKRLEELWLPDDEFPVIMPRSSDALFLIQRIRDEAHRFAITFHRTKRGKAMVKSALDGIEGLGPTKRETLIKHFGSLKQLSLASAEQLQEVKGIGPSMAAKIVEHFAERKNPLTATLELDRSGETSEIPEGGFNPITGELLDQDATS